MLLGKDIIRNNVENYNFLNSEELVNFLFYRIQETEISRNLDEWDVVSALECMLSHMQEISDLVTANNNIGYLTPENKIQSNDISLYENIYRVKVIGTLRHYCGSIALSL